MKRRVSLAIATCLIAMGAIAKDYSVKSPNGMLNVNIQAGGNGLKWSVCHDGQTVMKPSAIDLAFTDGRSIGANLKVKKTKKDKVDTSFATPLYHKTSVADRYNQLTLTLANGCDLQVRAYDDAAAYRIVLNQKDSVDIASETAEFNFGSDKKAWIPYVNDLRDKSYPYSFSFESYYDEAPLGEMFADSLACTPALIELEGGKKALVMEGALMDYPGMFLLRSDDGNSLQSAFAPVPKKDITKGFNHLNLIPTESENYIARVAGNAALPWRTVAVTTADGQLANLDLAMCLAEPNRIGDISWIKPGKVAWDWWNDWGLTGVDFEAGINTDTYKYYIDFAARRGLQYVILDEGWAKDSGSLSEINPDIDLEAIIIHANEKNIGIVLWATWQQLRDDYANLLKKYADMGVKGFKVDFFDRDDQKVTSSVADIAEEAANLGLILDLHGFRPIGLQRTYPNIVNYEGVKGLENYKWGTFRAGDPDQLRYDVTIPFIRMAAGPLDYTPGAMTNSTQASYRPSNDAPMSLGTRAHQVAMYVIYDGALQMLADSPSAYDREPECTDFMASIPTVFDETRVLAGEVGEYVAIARRAGDVWYIGAMTNASPRTLALALEFLNPEITYDATILSDGINAAKHPIDYKISTRKLTKDSTATLSIDLAPGGGWTAVLSPVK